MDKKNLLIFVFISIINFALLIIIFIKRYDIIKSNQNKNKKNLIVGVIYRYPWYKIRNYFVSLAKAGFKNIDVVMFVKYLSKETIEKLKSYGVILFTIPDNPDLVYKCQRYELYAQYLKENKDKYNMVLHTDVRDTIFQKDVFQFYNPDKPFFSVSEEDTLIKDNMNKAWILSITTESIYEQYFADKKAICSGLLIGTPDKFIELNNSIVKLAQGKQLGDQRYINYIIYYEKLFGDRIIIKNNYNSHLMHIGITNRTNINLDKDDNILNFNGGIASVVHQYDRHKDIVEKFDKKFSDYNFNYTVYKEQQRNKNIFSKSRMKIYIIMIIVFNIVVMSIIFIKKKLNNYIIIPRNNKRKSKNNMLYNLKKKGRKKFKKYNKLLIHNIY